MMIVQEFLQIVLAICLFLLPAVLMAALLRLPPLFRLTQRNRSMRTGLVLGNGLLCFVIYYGVLAWFVADAIYGFAKFYFDSTFGLAPGVTPAQVEQFKRGVINELWLRGLFPAWGGQRCFSGRMTVCQLADIASKGFSPESYWVILLGIALFSALITLLLGIRFTRPRTDRRNDRVTAA